MKIHEQKQPYQVQSSPPKDGDGEWFFPVGDVMTEARCTCSTCWPNYPYFRVCPDCGNKRCPKAKHHDHACTNSNEPGQKGSNYE